MEEARLKRLLDRVAEGKLGAAEALDFAGQSFRRDGRVDSAIVCHRRALELDATEPRLFALADQLLLRRSPADLAEAVERLEAARASSEQAAPAPTVGRLAWARFQLGNPDSAHVLWAAVAPRLAVHPEWRFRLARVALARGDHRSASDLLLPDAVRTRGTDVEVVRMLEQVGEAAGMTRQLQQEVRRRVEDGDQPALAMARELGGQLIALDASDGFTLGGMLVPSPKPARRRPPRLAVVLLAPADTLGAADSLVAAFRRHGLTTLVLYPRGTGASVGPSCPSPEAWFDREAALQARVARDVVDAARRVRALTPVDTSHYVVAAAGASATMAVEAATLDARVRALLLVSPAPELVDWGTTRARLAGLRLPVFYQVGADDIDASWRITDALYQAGDRAASRVVESRTPGSGLAQFRDDPQLAARFLGWLDAALGARGRRGR